MSHPTRSSSGDAEWTKFDQLPADVMLRINGYCDRFTGQWQSGTQVSLEQFIDQLPTADRASALGELIDIDLHFRACKGLALPLNWYLERWPELDAIWLADRIQHYFEGQAHGEAHGEASLATPLGDASPFSLTQVGDYVIDGPLGTGGMGRIYRARHRLMGRQVALKVLKEDHWQDDSSRRRFEREVQLLAKLAHPNILTAFDARQENGLLVLVTELVEGEDLAKRIKRLGPASPLQAMQYARQAACGLKYAHEQNIIHRDIKPGNLLLSFNQTIKVLDLGLARWSEPLPESQVGVSSLTGVEQVVGTPQYMAPEQARTPLLADHRADIYSLGCSLYYLLTGAPPYAGQSSIDAIVAHWEQPTPRLPSRVNEQVVSDDLADVVQSMMAKQIEMRIQSMQEVIAKLDALIHRAEEAESTDNALTTTDQNLKSLAAIDETLVASSAEIPVGAAVHERQTPAIADPLNTDPLKTGHQENGHQANRRRSLQVGMAIAVLLATAFAVVYFRNDLGSNRPPSPTDAGVEFDGRADFIAVDNFAARADRPVRMEVAAIANAQSNPANLVSWTGNPSLFIFTSAEAWGVAYQSDGKSQLIVSRDSVRFGQPQLICGEWTGEALRLYVDGDEVETLAFNYPMSPTAHGLYLGGVPAGVLPEEQGPRFFDGTIFTVRISELAETPPEKDWRSLANRTDQTLFIFPPALAPAL